MWVSARPPMGVNGGMSLSTRAGTHHFSVRRWSRLVAGASAAYGVFALVKPDHLASGLEADDTSALRTLAMVFGAREVAVGTLALLGERRVVSACMAARLSFDLSDCAILLSQLEDEAVQRKVLGVTLGWGAVNALAVLADLADDRG